MLRSVFVIVAAVAAAGGAVAQGRPTTTAMSCAQSAGLVRSSGALVLGTGGRTYDRFVADRRFCEITEVTRAAFVPTRDNPSCFIGYRCREPARDDWIGDN